jgi:hypothetical protein
MENDNRNNQDDRNQRDQPNPSQDSFPGNPNKQKQDSPRQQQGGDKGLQNEDRPHLTEDRSVTDRTVRRSVIDRSNEDDDGDIDALKG